MPTTGAHGIIIPDPSTANATVNQVRDLAIQTEAGLADVEATVAAAIDLDSYATKTYVGAALGPYATRTYVDDALSGIGTSGSSNLTVVSGAVTLDNGLPVGTLVGYRATASTTFTGQGGSVSLAAGVYIFERVTGGWTYRTIDEGTGLTPDTTNPTAGTLAVSGVTHNAATLTITGASDNLALHASPYAFSTNNGSTWTGYQSPNVYTATGLTASTSYTFRHRVRDAAGNVSQGTAVTRPTTSGPPPTPDIFDDFAGVADGTNINGRVTPVGAATWSNATMAHAVIHGEKYAPTGLPNEGILTFPTRGAVMASFDYDKGSATSHNIDLQIRSGSTTLWMIRCSVADSEIRLYRGGTTQITAANTPLPATGTLTLGHTGTEVFAQLNGTDIYRAADAPISADGFRMVAPTNATIDNVGVFYL